MEYIGARKLKEEIKRFSAIEYNDNTFGDDVANGALDYVLEEIIPSLQHEQPEMDLEKEVSKWWDASFPEPDFKFKKHQAHIISNNEIIKLAKYFYELGLNTRKED